MNKSILQIRVEPAATMPAQTMAKSKPAMAELSLDSLRQIEINFQEDIHINS